MTMKLYDLVGCNGLHFSPFGWRVRMALAHKGITAEIVPVHFFEIELLPSPSGKPWKMVPILESEISMIGDSWKIAMYLEEHFPNRPSLFGGESGVALSDFFRHWVETSVHPLFAGGLMGEVLECLDERDKEYFRSSREKRFGASLEELRERADAGIQLARNALEPANKRLDVSGAPFFGGNSPLFADYILFSSLQWARIVSQKEIIRTEGPIRNWMNRCQNLFSSMARSFPSRREWESDLRDAGRIP